MAKFFDRQELIGLRERALDLSDSTGMSPTWVRAYLALADAADRLDAMEARCMAAQMAAEVVVQTVAQRSSDGHTQA
jgi:hypothetical protein